MRTARSTRNAGTRQKVERKKARYPRKKKDKNTKVEIWEDLPGHSLYEFSDVGNVRIKASQKKIYPAYPMRLVNDEMHCTSALIGVPLNHKNKRLFTGVGDYEYCNLFNIKAFRKGISTFTQKELQDLHASISKRRKKE